MCIGGAELLDRHSSLRGTLERLFKLVRLEAPYQGVRFGFVGPQDQFGVLMDHLVSFHLRPGHAVYSDQVAGDAFETSGINCASAITARRNDRVVVARDENARDPSGSPSDAKSVPRSLTTATVRIQPFSRFARRADNALQVKTGSQSR